MDNLEGMLMVPPDRNQIIGRALWKLRFVVVGRRSAVGIQRDMQGNPSYTQLITSSRSNTGLPKQLTKASTTDDCCIIIYKHREDSEPSQQWPISSVSDCQVQMLAHRKQGPVLPTLVVTIADKDRKRRSSRAAGLISSSKDNAISLWFRTNPDEQNHLSLYDWARFIQSKRTPLSPESPISPQFSNPFSPRPRDATETFPRPTSGSQRSECRGLQHKSSTNTHSTGTRERPLTFSSESLSLRSKRSDVSSPSISTFPSQHTGYVPGQLYTTILPTDLPADLHSPITSAGGEYQGEFIEGWTSAQGRASTMSSPIRGRGSISSQTRLNPIGVHESNSSPHPRETILDRAFSLRCIPGTEQEIPGEEKLSSLARFDALMREADEKRKQREAAERAQQIAMRSAFEASGSSEEEAGGDSDDTDDDNFADEHERRNPPLIPPTTQRALQFITSRHTSIQSPTTASRPPMTRTPSSFAPEHQTTLVQAPPMRPHTAHARSRPNASNRSQSTPLMMGDMAKLEISSPVSRIPEGVPVQINAEKRQSISSNSTKRLSFTEFTKRLSSTSSLLLVQTNVSGGSSRGSDEIDLQSAPVSRGPLTLRGSGAQPPFTRERDLDDYDKRCGWRNSVGVIGNEGGFV